MHETTRILDEKVTRKVEHCEDPATGKLRFQTIEYVEKLVEHKVWASMVGERVEGLFLVGWGRGEFFVEGSALVRWVGELVP